MRKRTIPMRSSENWHNFMKELDMESLKRGLSKRNDGMASITDQLARDDKIRARAKEVILSRPINIFSFNNFKKHKRGGAEDLLFWIVVSFTAIMFLALMYYGITVLSSRVSSITTIGTSVNTTTAYNNTFGKLMIGLPGLRNIAWIIMIGMIISIFITYFLEPVHPAFFGAYALIYIIAIVFSAFVSNSYESLLSDALIGPTLQTFSAGTFIMLYLPWFVGVVGGIGGIILFAGINRDSRLGGSL